MLEFIILYGKKHLVADSVAEHIYRLEKKIRDLETANDNLKMENKQLIPFIKDNKLKPAISSYCLRCDFATRSPWTGGVVGCFRDNVCDCFKQEN